MKYFIHRAPDFFDWRSGVFEFPTKQELLEQECSQILQEGNYKEYCALTPEERVKKVLEIQELLTENHQQPIDRARLQFKLGILLVAAKEYEAAIASYDQALHFKPDDTSAFYNKACLYALQGNVELAIENLQQAIKLSPEEYRAMAKTDSDFDKIREDERFQALMQPLSEN